VQLVIADTGPINYLIDIIPRLCEKVVLPAVVQAEMADGFAPSAVRRWIASPPAWLQIVGTPEMSLAGGLHKGEAAATALAASLGADLLHMDDCRGVHSAERLGIRVTGTLGVLDIAADRDLIDFGEPIHRLETTFQKPIRLIQALPDKHKARKQVHLVLLDLAHADTSVTPAIHARCFRVGVPALMGLIASRNWTTGSAPSRRTRFTRCSIGMECRRHRKTVASIALVAAGAEEEAPAYRRVTTHRQGKDDFPA
jgi:predicted nucleic acid-binding protein